MKRFLHWFGIHDWVPRYIVWDGGMRQRGSYCTVCKTIRAYADGRDKG